jgi:N-acetylneuraminate synthase
VYVVAEVSANHHQRYDEAVRLVHAAKDAGADAVKLQTYTPDTITLNVPSEVFRRPEAPAGQPQYLYDLYALAYTPWEWQPRLKTEAERIGLTLFSTPFDPTAVDLLESMNVPVYKIASFELVDIPLIRRVAQTGKPIIMSTGMATLAEIDEAVRAIRAEGNEQIALLKCSSVYPARPEDLNLLTLPHMAHAFGVPAGFSDHTLGIASSVAAVALGATIIEKHLTISRAEGGPDAHFSLEPHEFRHLVEAVRVTERALGRIQYEPTEAEMKSRVFRRSLFAVRDIQAGEAFSVENVRSIRPGHGLHPRHFEELLGKAAACNIKRGAPLSWKHVKCE